MTNANVDKQCPPKSTEKEEENNSSENASKMSKTAQSGCSLRAVTGAAGRGSVIGAAAGLVMELRAGFRVSSWKVFPFSMARGALAFGSALGIYEATKCKLMQVTVMDDLSRSTIAGSLGTGLGGTFFGTFPWTRPNCMKMYPEKFKQFRKEIPKNFVKYAAKYTDSWHLFSNTVGGVYFALESIVISKYFPDKQDTSEQQLSFSPSKGIR